MMSRNLLSVAVVVALVGGLSNADAQKYVVLSNVDAEAETETVESHPGSAAIPLTGSAQIDSEGNIIVSCASATNCPNIGSGAGVVTDVPSFTTFPATLQVNSTALASAGLSWAATEADACYGKNVERIAWTGSGAGPAAPSGWKEVRATSGAYGLTSLYNNVGAGNSATFEFTMRCYSSASVGIANQAIAVGAKEAKSVVTLSPPAGSTPSPSGNCQAYIDSLGAEGTPARDHFEAYRAENRGFTAVSTTVQAKTQKVPGVDVGQVAGAVLPGVLGDTQYLAMSFSLPNANPPANTGKFNLQFLPPTGGGMEHQVVATISPCPGDFRPRDNESEDIYLSTYCRQTYTMSGAVRGNTAAGDNLRCKLPANQTLYINISLRDLFQAGNAAALPQDSCPNTQSCGVSSSFTK